jgi:hypothetical protein
MTPEGQLRRSPSGERRTSHRHPPQHTRDDAGQSGDPRDLGDEHVRPD